MQTANKKSEQPPQLAKATFIKVKDLTPNSRGGFNIVVKAIEQPKLQINRLYLDGTQLKVSSVLIGDETGCVFLHLKDEQIDQVNKDDTLLLRNAQVQIVKSHIHVRVDKWGIIERLPREQFNAISNIKNNVSEITWELADPQTQPAQDSTRAKGKQGPPRQGPPRQGPRQGPPRQGPRQGPPREGPLREGPPRQGPPRQGPPRQGPPRQGPPRQGPLREGPLREGPPRQGPPRQGPPRQGPPRQGPPRQGISRQGQSRQEPIEAASRQGPEKQRLPKQGAPREALQKQGGGRRQM